MEEKQAGPQAGEAVMNQAYPAPTPMVNTTKAEPEYYQQLGAHQELGSQQQQHPPHQEHQVYHAQPQGHSEHDDHHDLQQLQQLQDSPATDQQSSRQPQPVSAEDLQLAAQLTQVTQGLAPMMEAEQGHTQGPHTLPQPNGQEGQFPSEQDQNLQQQLEASLQSHDQALHEHTQHALAEVLPPHPGPAPQYPAPAPAPSQLGQHGLPLGNIAQAGTQPVPDPTPPRKRTKVSRACDECRRKKIKCDGLPEATDQPCSNCRRSNVQCLFSRVPQKRGPSKGYIKELADRINTIEGKLNSTAGRRASVDTPPSEAVTPDQATTAAQGRKRPFSSISGDSFSTTSHNQNQNSTSTFPPENRSLNSSIPQKFHQHSLERSSPKRTFASSSSTSVGQSASTNSVEMSPQEFYQNPNDAESLEQSLAPQNLVPEIVEEEPERMPELLDDHWTRYLDTIHPYFPILAATKDRVHNLVWEAPLPLQSAFEDAFYAMVRHTHPPYHGQCREQITRAYQTVMRSRPSPARSPTSPAELVSLQTMLMLVLATEWPAVGSSSASPSTAELLTWATAMSHKMRLYAHSVEAAAGVEPDADSKDRIALRNWAVLVVLDRLASVGQASPPRINEAMLEFRTGVKGIVGDYVWGLLQITYSLSQCHPVVTAPRPAINDGVVRPEATETMLLRGTVRMLQWNITDMPRDLVLELAYWHVYLLVELSGHTRQHPQQQQWLRVWGHPLAEALGRIIDLLPGAGQPDLYNPVVQHCCALVGLLLLEVLLEPGLQAGAVPLEEVVRARANQFLEGTDSTMPWHRAVKRALESCGRVGQQQPTGQVEGAAVPAVSAGPSGLQEVSAVVPAVSAGVSAGVSVVSAGSVTAPAAAAVVAAAAPPTPALPDVASVLASGYIHWFEHEADSVVAAGVVEDPA